MSNTSTCPPPYEEYNTFSPLEVEIKGISFEEGVRRFRSIVNKSKVLALYKEKQSFEKPSAKKRRLRREAVEKRRIADLRDSQIASGEWDKKQKRREQKRNNRFEDDE